MQHGSTSWLGLCHPAALASNYYDMRRAVRRGSITICIGLLSSCAEEKATEDLSFATDSVEAVVAAVDTSVDTSGFVVARTPLRNDRYAGWEAYVRERRLLEGWVDFLNGWISLSERITVTFAACGRADAFYEPQTRTITMCYELLPAFTQAFREIPAAERDQAVLGATDFILYHEIGHALIDVLDLPVVGREEDAADQLAVYILTGGTEEDEQAAIDGAVALHRLEEGMDEGSFADEHSLGPQRFYNIACWVYGQNPEKYTHLLLGSGGVLPEARAERCPAEYEQLQGSWDRLLDRYLKES